MPPWLWLDLRNGKRIAADVQRRGHGRVLSVLVEVVEDYARRLGLNTLLVNADPRAVGYSEKMGWGACVWDQTDLTGFTSDYGQMTKVLPQKSFWSRDGIGEPVVLWHGMTLLVVWNFRTPKSV